MLKQANLFNPFSLVTTSSSEVESTEKSRPLWSFEIPKTPKTSIQRSVNDLVVKVLDNQGHFLMRCCLKRTHKIFLKFCLEMVTWGVPKNIHFTCRERAFFCRSTTKSNDVPRSTLRSWSSSHFQVRSM